MKSYARITLDRDNGGKRFILRIDSETDGLLVGIEVKKNGDEVTGKNFDERKWIIMKDTIAKRVPMVFNNTYGELENA